MKKNNKIEHTLDNAIEVIKKSPEYNGDMEVRTAVLFYTDKKKAHLQTVGDPKDVGTALIYMHDEMIPNVISSIKNTLKAEEPETTEIQ